MWAHFVVINRCWTIADDNVDVMNWEGGICWPEWQSHWMLGVVLVGCDFHLHAKATEFTCIFHLVDSALTRQARAGQCNGWWNYGNWDCVKELLDCETLLIAERWQTARPPSMMISIVISDVRNANGKSRGWLKSANRRQPTTEQWTAVTLGDIWLLLTSSKRFKIHEIITAMILSKTHWHTPTHTSTCSLQCLDRDSVALSVKWVFLVRIFLLLLLLRISCSFFFENIAIFKPNLSFTFAIPFRLFKKENKFSFNSILFCYCLSVLLLSLLTFGFNVFGVLSYIFFRIKLVNKQLPKFSIQHQHRALSTQHFTCRQTHE